VIAGSVNRVELVPGPRVFDLMVAALLLPLGIWLAATRNHDPDQSARPARRIPARAERIEVGELRPLTDDWMLLTVMAAGMGNRHESVRTGGWDGLPGRRWRWGWRQPTR